LVQKLVATKLIPPTVQDNDGWTPVETAKRFGLNSIELQLLEAGFSDEATQMLDCNEQLGWSTEDRQDALVVKDRVSVVVEESKCCVSPFHLIETRLTSSIASFEYITPPLRDLYAVVRANRPMRPLPRETVCYFEVKIEHNVEPR